MSDYSVVCTINKSEPPYQPNVYLCKTKSYCCISNGQPMDPATKRATIYPEPFFVFLDQISASPLWLYHIHEKNYTDARAIPFWG
ncbi:hypothetical protein ANCCAN_07783 [Ancylostoma caninum]|uniref:Uncharacterized protein n=1 Tax=Ancylostoma caninum TaxID=29170 RepID=A0A368GTF4_ANCCA|nr:hypothetical protein ANCCAN_07783 [Ancylostoma caninum]